MKNKHIPTHIAFIMDGNRRWARKNALGLFAGHHKGAERIENLVEYGAKRGIRYMTFWAFSTENWSRKRSEVETLMNVFRDMLSGPIFHRMMENGIRVLTIGDISVFPKDIYEKLLEVKKESEKNTRAYAIFGLNYGGRSEILQVVNTLLRESKKNVTEKEFAAYLFTKDIPDPDFIVRTGGEQRLSGFLPWQGTYSELYFTDTLWPDFNEEQLQIALDEFENRERRFGK